MCRVHLHVADVSETRESERVRKREREREREREVQSERERERKTEFAALNGHFPWFACHFSLFT